MNRKAVKYLRFSADEQSNYSIERQEMITASWMSHHDVELVDCFIDEGFTATNFDRPDFKKLYSFIEKNYRGIDYLVVADLTRFSREAGDALNIAKEIQRKYGVRIVSAGRGSVYDCTDHNSFFMMGLEFLLGNTENLKRMNDINSGIYAAKAIKQRYIGPHAPFGYRKEGRGKNVLLVPVEEEARVIRFMYEAFLKNVPSYIITADAVTMGFKATGNSALKKVLECPIYCSHQWVKAYKEQPAGLFPLKDQEPIIDVITWNRVQLKIKANNKPRISVADEMPLRGVLHCHCGKLLTGAPSKGKSGNYFYYYKCQDGSRHNNISAVKAHGKLQEIFQYMSLSGRQVKVIVSKSEKAFDIKMKDNSKTLADKQRELAKVEASLQSLEQKWIEEKVTFETYNRWFRDYTHQRSYLRAQVKSLSGNVDTSHSLLIKHIHELTDMGYIYTRANTVQKQQLVRVVFDNGLYFENGSYRTPFIIPQLSHNELIMREKQLLFVDKKGDFFSKIPSGGAGGGRTRVQTHLP
ncbi:MAG TPA: recombinase family protein [Chitinophagaceae bacterium]|nr:recombinase family protein [Chitinophagaceae bacterium]